MGWNMKPYDYSARNLDELLTPAEREKRVELSKRLDELMADARLLATKAEKECDQGATYEAMRKRPDLVSKIRERTVRLVVN